MKNVLTLSLISLMLLTTGCGAPKSQTLTTQKPVEEDKVEIPHYDPVAPQEFKWITEDGGKSQLDFNPQVDILFVIDNSDSMKSAQENLKRNFDKFTSGIVQNKMIDYHIGVTSTWDSSERALAAKKDRYAIGDLRFIKDSKGQSYNQRFLTRKTGSGDLLSSTIDIGVMPYKEGGPEIEEFFSPLSSALEKTGAGATNEGFFRDNSQLVVVIMTDADDSTSRTSPEQMAQTLVDFKKGAAEKVSVYGVLVSAQDPDDKKDYDLRIHPKYHPECFDKNKKGQPVVNGRCKGFGPDRLEQMIIAANSTSGTPDQIRKKFIMDITSPNFGSELARIGSDITVKTLEKRIYLEQRPRFDESTKKLMLKVRYGSPQDLAAGRGQIIPPGEQGWLYNPDDNSVFLSGRIRYQYVESGRFAVDLVPLTLKQ